MANSCNAIIENSVDAVDKTIHVILTVRDDGRPALARYRILVISGVENKESGQIFH